MHIALATTHLVILALVITNKSALLANSFFEDVWAKKHFFLRPDFPSFRITMFFAALT